jgi:genome maintenance exonuclease 1
MITKKYDYSPLDRTTIDGKRHYCLPDGSKVPSVTTILDKTKPEEKKQALNQWKKRMGEEKAQQIVTEAANRGTRMHSYLENYILSDDMKPLPTNPYAQPSWYMAAQVILEGLQHVDEFWGTEVPVYYSGLYAGTTDCVGIWKGKPAILDFKQTNKPKKKEWIDDYFLQLLFYATAHNHMFNTEIKTGVILMCAQPENPDATPRYQEFTIEGNEWKFYEQEMHSRVETYYLLMNK